MGDMERYEAAALRREAEADRLSDSGMWEQEPAGDDYDAPLTPLPGDPNYDADLHSPATCDGFGNDF